MEFRMKKKIFTALLISSMLLISACGSKKEAGYKLKNTTTFEQTGYTIDLPDTWTRTSNTNTDLTFYYASSKNNEFTENITTMVQDISAYDYDLESYKDLSVSSYEDMGYKVKDCKKSSVDDNDCYIITSTAEGNDSKIYCKQMFVLKDKKAYLFTFAAEKEDYNKLSKQVDAIFDTVTFNDKVMTPAEP